MEIKNTRIEKSLKKVLLWPTFEDNEQDILIIKVNEKVEQIADLLSQTFGVSINLMPDIEVIYDESPISYPALLLESEEGLEELEADISAMAVLDTWSTYEVWECVSQIMPILEEISLIHGRLDELTFYPGCGFCEF